MTTFTNQIKTGVPWNYNQTDLTYNASVDPVTAQSVTYNGIGSGILIFTNQTKS